MTDQMNLEQMKKMLDPKHIGSTIRMFIQLGQADALDQLMDNADLIAEGPDFMASAVRAGHPKIIDLLCKKGVKLEYPPNNVSMAGDDPLWSVNYRKTPFLLQACQMGNVDVVQHLVTLGQPLFQLGHIMLSRRKANSVISNAVACAAYHGHEKLMKFLLTKASASLSDEVNVACSELNDIHKTGDYKSEFADYTPLMLAIVSDKANLEVVKQLLASQSNFNVREKSTGNNILHLAAASCPNLDIIDYLVRSLNQDMLFERNQKGDTPLNICVNTKNKPATELMEKLQATYDKSGDKADALFNSLDAEEKKKEREQQKKKEKKYAQKLKKMAERDKTTVEETAARLQADKKRKADEETNKEQAQVKKEAAEEKARIAFEQERNQTLNKEKTRIAKENEVYRQERAQERALRQENQIQSMRERAAKDVVKAEVAKGDQTLNKKQRNDMVQQERRRMKSVAALSAKDDSDDETPEVDNKLSEKDGKKEVVGLNGQMAVNMLTKRQKKKMVAALNAEEDEEKALKDRILAAKKQEMNDKARVTKAYEAEERAALKAEKDQLKLATDAAKREKEAASGKKQQPQAKAAAIKTDEQPKVHTKLVKQRHPLDEVFNGGGATRMAARAKSMGMKENMVQSTPLIQKPIAGLESVDLDLFASEIKPAKAKKNKSIKREEVVAQPQKFEPKNILDQAYAAPSEPKQKKEKKQQPKKENKPVQEAVVLNKVEAVPMAPKQPKAAHDKNQSKDVAAIQRELDMERNRNRQHESLVQKLQQEINELQTEKLLAETANQSMHQNNSSNTELMVELKKIQDQHQTQVAVNKALASKVLIFERQIKEETKKRQDAERMLTSNNSSFRNYAASGNDLNGIQDQMRNLKNRVNNLN